MAERRCGHGFLRSQVTCKACDRIDFLLTGFRREKRTRPVVHKAIRHLPPAPSEWLADPHSVIEAVARAWRIPALSLFERDRRAHVAEARSACFWLLRKLTILSWPQMGARVGNRHHTTAMSGFRTTEVLRRQHDRVRELTDQILKAFEEKKGAAA